MKSVNKFMSYIVSLQSLPYRAGQQSIGNLATSQSVLFTSLMPTTGYTVNLSFNSAVTTAVSSYISNTTISGFTINLGAGIAGGATVNYVAWLNN